MATHSTVLAWRIPGTGEPGGLPSMGLQSRTWLKWLSSSSCNEHGGTRISFNSGFLSVYAQQWIAGSYATASSNQYILQLLWIWSEATFLCDLPLFLLHMNHLCRLQSIWSGTWQPAFLGSSLLTGMEQVRRRHSESPGLVFHPHRPAGWVLHTPRVLSSLSYWCYLHPECLTAASLLVETHNLP